MRTKSILLLIVFGLLSMNHYAQDHVFEWGVSGGGNGYDVENSLRIDDLGFIYSTGSFSGTVDFDPGPGIFNLSSNGEEDIFVQKLDPLGNLVWVQSFGGSHNENHSSIANDTNNNLYITGTFENSVDFEPGTGNNILTSNGGTDIFILKLDVDGNMYWVKSIGGTFNDYPSQINVDNANNVILTGTYGDTVDFDPGTSDLILSSNGGWDIYILKMDQDANLVWAKSVGGSSFDSSRAITTDASDNIYIIGSFFDIVDFNPGVEINNLISDGLSDVFILKLNPDGQYVWGKSIGGNDIDLSASIKVDHSNNLIVIGDFRGTVDFSPDTSEGLQTSNGDYDVFILKLDTEGDFIWVETINSHSSVLARDVAIDQFDNLYLTGEFNAAIDFEIDDQSHSINSIGNDIYVFKLDTFGNLKWGKSIGGNSFDASRSILIDSSHNIILAGFFEETVDFDPGDDVYNLTSNGSVDFFITKWSQDFSNPTTAPLNELDIDFYPNPTMDYLIIDKQNNSEIQLNIIDITGNVVVSKKLINKKTILDLSNINSGLYFINFESDSYMDTKKIYKN